MEKPIKRQERIMTDDIRKRQGLAGETDAQLTTAELAGAGEPTPRAANVESLVETKSRPEEIAAGPLTGVMGGTETPGTATARAMERETGPLFSSSEANDCRARWDAIQVGFVDEPRRAVELADNLVAGTMKRLAEIFADERSKLESQWDQGENVSTEDLRLALRRYRSFFGRLLSI
jgi:hypothetical protein